MCGLAQVLALHLMREKLKGKGSFWEDYIRQVEGRGRGETWGVLLTAGVLLLP